MTDGKTNTILTGCKSKDKGTYRLTGGGQTVDKQTNKHTKRQIKLYLGEHRFPWGSVHSRIVIRPQVPLLQDGCPVGIQRKIHDWELALERRRKAGRARDARCRRPFSSPPSSSSSSCSSAAGTYHRLGTLNSNKVQQ